MKLEEQLIEGIYIKEHKSRFLCDVMINRCTQECFIPNSSKMNKYLKLNNKNILLTVNKGSNNRTKYSIFAVKYYNKYILLNLNKVNSLLYESIINKEIKRYRTFKNLYLEKQINGYKADLVELGEETIIIENKAVIGVNKDVIFPNVYSERFLRQLTKLKDLLEEGIKVHYNIISLSPMIKKVFISNEQKEYRQLLIECISKGMIVRGMNIEFINGELIVKERLRIII